jgi:DNA polymerase-3 subunit alpha
MEKEISGVYITGHPLDDYRETLQKLPFSTVQLDGIEEREDHGMEMDGMFIDMGGILTEVKGKATKKGAYMGFITIEDLTGQIECLVFPKVYEKYQAMMAVDDLVVLSGKLSIREDEAPKLLVDTLTPLDMWEEKPKATVPDEPGNRRPRVSTVERVPAPSQEHPPRAAIPPRMTDSQRAANASRKLFIQLERPRMDEAVHMLELHPGSIPVYLHIPAEKATFLLPSLKWCDGSEGCMNRLTTAFGESNVKIVEKK